MKYQKIKIEWAAGFLPHQGAKAQGMGYEAEKAPTIRVFDTGGVLIKYSELPENNRSSDGK